LENIRRIGFVGSGNVATQLALAFADKHFEIPIIIGRSARKARMLAKRVNSKGSNDFAELANVSLDLLILAVNDHSIEEVVEKVKELNIPIVHTSGATSISVLAGHTADYGVFYPLQTLTKEEYTEFRLIPICIDAPSEDFKNALVEIGNRISTKVHEISDEQRVDLHLCATLMNNNINHLLAKIEDILVTRKLPRGILDSLLKETVQKAKYKHPADVQTGPAIRNDLNTKQTHLKLIESFEDEQLKHIYNCFWDSIQAYHKKSGEGII
jgi:predicted short-subunit dehydrogenase-like oxidoreductase (DUF2520 family)